jgi:hypothetical protein
MQLSIPCRPGTPTYKLQIKTKSGACIHVPPCAIRYWTLPPCQGGLWCCRMSCGSGPCLPAIEGSGAAHVSRGSRPRLPASKCSGVIMCTMALDPAILLGRAPMLPCALRLRTLPPRWEVSGASIKKNLSGLLMQLGPHVSKACVHVSKMPNVRAIMGMQDVRKGSAFNACKTCGHADIVQL